MLLHMLMSKIQVTFSKYLFVKESFRLQYLLGFIFSCKQLPVIKKHYISNERIKTNFHSYFEHESWFLICKSATTFKVQNRKFTCKTKFWQKREKHQSYGFLALVYGWVILYLKYFRINSVLMPHNSWPMSW